MWFYRPPDAAQSFNQNIGLRFSAKSPCDCFIYNGELFYTLELKSVGTTSISYEKIKGDRGVIHKHQIDKLAEFSEYKNIVSGFIFDFRISGKTYFCTISDFIEMINKLDKKSFNEKDLHRYCSPILIEKKKLKVNYRYDVNSFLHDTTLERKKKEYEDN